MSSRKPPSLLKEALRRIGEAETALRLLTTAMRQTPGYTTLILGLTLLFPLGCGGFFSDSDEKGPHHHGGAGRGGHHRGPGGPVMDAGCDNPAQPQPDATTGVPDAGIEQPTADAGAGFPDATTSTNTGEGFDASVPDVGSAPDATAPACTTSAECASGNNCQSGACVPCAGGICVCRRDDDCPALDVCDHLAGTCGPPIVRCTEITVEATCIDRTDCQAVYAGVNCRDAQGGACTSADPECTCETFSFAACIVRP